jgi:CBS domain containing-hemolysin-like protein
MNPDELLLSIVIALILGISWLCSLLEGFILSITTAEVESLKNRHPQIGHALEAQKNDLESATAAILTLNNIANIAGSSISGYLAGKIFSSTGVALLTGALTFVVLFFCEILPKNLGVRLRRKLAVFLTPILSVIMWILKPVTIFSFWLTKRLMPARKHATEEERQDEILLLINKGMKEGFFTVTEKEMVFNTLNLDDKPVTLIMTPLERIVALPADEQLSSVLRHISKKPFSRMPVYENAEMVGFVNRDDLLHAAALDNHTFSVRSLMKPLIKISSDATIADLLQLLLKNHQEMCLVESSAKQTLGLVTMEDIIKHLIGQRARLTA